ncbi:TRAP transporter small permease [Oceanobacillus alkalisoli]|uniref:TRAP transporter small permease n=1 Tax=Oceanobacillus alkalisoli TaxID=2925113 RepID=UPI001F1217DA|nr:TRAP transporter small permease [Oceanobacillus alkalisoli]MCF3942595.1 TRAP transporter small permease [Oceanobacillus alkalisoli]
MKLLTGYNKLMGKVNQFVGYFLALLLLIMTILITWQVFARFVVGSPLTFSEEIARFIMIWLTMLGSAYALRKGTLISLDVLLEFGGKTVGAILKYIIPIISILFALILIIYGFQLTGMVSYQTAPSTRVSMMWPMLALPVSGIVIVLNSISLLIDQIVGKEEKKA